MKIFHYIFFVSFITTCGVGIFVLGTQNAQAVFNKEINYQGKLLTNAGVTVADASYNLRFRLYTAASSGSLLWTETWCYSPDNGSTCDGSGTDNRISLTSGLFSTLLGSTTALTGVDFNQTLWLEVSVGGSGTTPSWEVLSPRKRLGAVPAAFEAQNAATVGGVASTSLLRSDASDSYTSGTLTFDAGTALVVNGTSTFSQATSSTLYTSTFGVNNSYFTSLTGSGLTNSAGVLTCATASGSVFGCLASADWTVFNNKVSTTSIDTEGELETLLTDVSNVFTNNDGALSDDDLSNNSIEDLSDVATMSEAYGNLFSWNGSTWTNVATSSLKINTNDITEGSSLFYTDARVASYINSSSTVPHVGGSAYGDLLSWTGSAWTNRATSTLGLPTFSSLSATYPVQYDGSGLFSLAFGTSTSNTWGGTQTFTYASSTALSVSGTSYLGTVASGLWNGTAIDFSSYVNATAGTGIQFTGDDIGFDCSEVEGTGINCTGEAVTLDATGDWTGTFDGLEGSAYLANSFSTTSAAHWETTQTARTADDLTNNSIEDLSDVASMTKNYGDVLYWNGSTWTDIATSSLGLGGGSSQWTTSGSDIYYTTGNVGIGLTAPAYKLEVNGSASTTNFYMPNTTSSALGVVYKGTNRFMHNYADPTSDGANTFIGVNAGNFTMGPGGGVGYLGSRNTAMGQNALLSNTTGYYNTAHGVYALYSNTTGYQNTANGVSALYSNTTGSSNIANGVQALYFNTTGFYNTANGVQALYFNTTGKYNTANGFGVLFYNRSATNTTALGYQAARGTANYSNQGGVYVGYQAGYSAGTGSDYNTMLGYQSGYGVTTGANNILLGYNAGYSGTDLTTGSNNIIIGHDIGATSTNQTRGLNIGNLIFGTGLDGTGTTLSTGNVGIGNSAPIVKLHVGSTAITNGTSLVRLEDSNSTCDFTANSGSPSCGSDRSLKKNIETLSGSLEKIAQLRLVSYNWQTDTEGQDKQTGFIAQEVRDIFPDLVSERKWIDGSTKLFLNTGALVPYLAGAIAELNLKVADLANATTSIGIEYTYEYDDAGTITKTISYFKDTLSALEARFEKLFAKEAEIENVKAKTICLDDVCISRDELKQVLDAAHATGATVPASGGGVAETENDNGTENAENGTGNGTSEGGEVDSGEAQVAEPPAHTPVGPSESVASSDDGAGTPSENAGASLVAP